MKCAKRNHGEMECSDFMDNDASAYGRSRILIQQWRVIYTYFEGVKQIIFLIWYSYKQSLFDTQNNNNNNNVFLAFAFVAYSDPLFLSWYDCQPSRYAYFASFVIFYDCNFGIN